MTMNKDSRILIACEESQIVTNEFRNRGFFNTFSCDLLPTSGEYPEWHLQQNVFDIINDSWDMMIAFLLTLTCFVVIGILKTELNLKTKI